MLSACPITYVHVVLELACGGCLGQRHVATGQRWEYGVLVDPQNKENFWCLLCGHCSSGGIYCLKQYVGHCTSECTCLHPIQFENDEQEDH
jgi:hypothetical protein